MFTKPEAEKFAKNLLEEVFPNGKISALIDFYHPDVIEHIDDKEYSFADIQSRMQLMSDSQHRYKVENVDVFENYIFCLYRKIDLENSDESSPKEFEFMICQFKGQKICETWHMVDKADQIANTTPNFSELSAHNSCDFKSIMLQ